MQAIRRALSMPFLCRDEQHRGARILEEEKPKKESWKKSKFQLGCRLFKDNKRINRVHPVFGEESGNLVTSLPVLNEEDTEQSLFPPLLEDVSVEGHRRPVTGSSIDLAPSLMTIYDKYTTTSSSRPVTFGTRDYSVSCGADLHLSCTEEPEGATSENDTVEAESPSPSLPSPCSNAKLVSSSPKHNPAMDETQEESMEEDPVAMEEACAEAANEVPSLSLSPTNHNDAKKRPLSVSSTTSSTSSSSSLPRQQRKKIATCISTTSTLHIAPEERFLSTPALATIPPVSTYAPADVESASSGSSTSVEQVSDQFANKSDLALVRESLVASSGLRQTSKNDQRTGADQAPTGSSSSLTHSYLENVIIEIVQTERVYVQDLQDIIEIEELYLNNVSANMHDYFVNSRCLLTMQANQSSVVNRSRSRPVTTDEAARAFLAGYLRPFSNSEDLEMPAEDIQALFGNIEAIHHFNQGFLESLEQCGCHAPQVAQCFVDKTKGFNIYTGYCTNYPRADRQSNCNIDKDYSVLTVHFYDPAFPYRSVKVLTRCMQNSQLAEAFKKQQVALQHGLPLGSYLLKPVQRILKYHLLLESMVCHYDRKGVGYETILEALESMTSMTHHINNMKRRHEHAVHIQEIQSLLFGWEGDDLTTYGELVLEDTFRMSGAKACRHLLLFEKGLLIAKKKEDATLVIKAEIVNSNLMLIESIPKEPFGFHVIPFDNPRVQYTFQARSIDQKRRWCHNIKRMILDNYNAVIPEKAKELVLRLGRSRDEDGAMRMKTRETPPKSHSTADYLERRRGRRRSTSIIPDFGLLKNQKGRRGPPSRRVNISSPKSSPVPRRKSDGSSITDIAEDDILSIDKEVDVVGGDLDESEHEQRLSVDSNAAADPTLDSSRESVTEPTDGSKGRTGSVPDTDPTDIDAESEGTPGSWHRARSFKKATTLYPVRPSDSPKPKREGESTPGSPVCKEVPKDPPTDARPPISKKDYYRIHQLDDGYVKVSPLAAGKFQIVQKRIEPTTVGDKDYARVSRQPFRKCDSPVQVIVNKHAKSTDSLNIDNLTSPHLESKVDSDSVKVDNVTPPSPGYLDIFGGQRRVRYVSLKPELPSKPCTPEEKVEKVKPRKTSLQRSASCNCYLSTDGSTSPWVPRAGLVSGRKTRPPRVIKRCLVEVPLNKPVPVEDTVKASRSNSLNSLYDNCEYSSRKSELASQQIKDTLIFTNRTAFVASPAAETIQRDHVINRDIARLATPPRELGPVELIKEVQISKEYGRVATRYATPPRGVSKPDWDDEGTVLVNNYTAALEQELIKLKQSPTRVTPVPFTNPSAKSRNSPEPGGTMRGRSESVGSRPRPSGKVTIVAGGPEAIWRDLRPYWRQSSDTVISLASSPSQSLERRFSRRHCSDSDSVDLGPFLSPTHNVEQRPKSDTSSLSPSLFLNNETIVDSLKNAVITLTSRLTRKGSRSNESSPSPSPLPPRPEDKDTEPQYPSSCSKSPKYKKEKDKRKDKRNKTVYRKVRTYSDRLRHFNRGSSDKIVKAASQPTAKNELTTMLKENEQGSCKIGARMAVKPIVLGTYTLPRHKPRRRPSLHKAFREASNSSHNQPSVDLQITTEMEGGDSKNATLDSQHSSHDSGCPDEVTVHELLQHDTDCTSDAYSPEIPPPPFDTPLLTSKDILRILHSPMDHLDDSDSENSDDTTFSDFNYEKKFVDDLENLEEAEVFRDSAVFSDGSVGSSEAELGWKLSIKELTRLIEQRYKAKNVPKIEIKRDEKAQGIRDILKNLEIDSDTDSQASVASGSDKAPGRTVRDRTRELVECAAMTRIRQNSLSVGDGDRDSREQTPPTRPEPQLKEVSYHLARKGWVKQMVNQLQQAGSS